MKIQGIGIVEDSAYMNGIEGGQRKWDRILRDNITLRGVFRRYGAYNLGVAGILPVQQYDKAELCSWLYFYLYRIDIRVEYNPFRPSGSVCRKNVRLDLRVEIPGIFIQVVPIPDSHIFRTRSDDGQCRLRADRLH